MDDEQEAAQVQGAAKSPAESSVTNTPEGEQLVDEQPVDEQPEGEQPSAHGSTAPPSLGKRKRKRQTGEAPPEPKNKSKYRPKERPNFGYIETLNDTIIEACEPKQPRLPTPGELRDSQFGLSEWTPAEKNQLFNLLSRPGWRSSRVLPSSISSKSDFEILHILQELAPLSKTLTEKDRAQDAPAAYDISDSCCEALDKEALKLARVQWDTEVAKEQEKVGYYAMLTPTLSVELAKAMSETTTLETTPILPHGNLRNAAELFNLKNWLTLSERFYIHNFLNDEQQMEQRVDPSSEPPALFATAFTDFYNLATSVTRRLISATLFQAASRLKSVGFENPPRLEPAVRRKDVLTALDMLSMDYNCISYFLHAPRRLGVEVYRSYKQKYKHREYYELMTYEEVEEELAIPAEKRWNSPGTEPDSPSRFSDDDNTTDPEAHAPTENFNQPPTDLTDKEMSDVTSEEDEIQPQEEDNEESEDAQDLEESALEEKRIWKFLNASRASRPGNPKASPERSYKNRTKIVANSEAGHSGEWKATTDFRSEWERYGYVLREDAFRKGGTSSARFRTLSKDVKTWKVRKAMQAQLDSDADADVDSEPDSSVEGLEGNTSEPATTSNTTSDVLSEHENTADHDQFEMDIDGENDDKNGKINDKDGENDDNDNTSDEDDSTDNEDDGNSSPVSQPSLRSREGSAPRYVFEMPEGVPRSAMDSDSEDEFRP